ncbi:MAG: hypothetical protein OQL09_09660 [Gammaproteobacteria bacterium]|nr:hypothetical protein [Gammaproteobacteria bacterium]
MISFPWSKSHYTLSLYIGINSVCAAMIEHSRSTNYPIKYLSIDYPSILNAEDNYQSLQTVLPTLLDHFDKELNFDYVPAQVALADTLVSSSVFELDQIPTKQSLKNELLAMRFQKDCHINMKNAAITSQVFQTRKQQALYAITAPDALISSIQAIFNNRQQNLCCIDKAIHYVFNHYYEQLSADAALLFNNDEYWTLIIWNSEKNVVYFRSKLHSNNDQLNSIADDVIRLLHTYQQNNQQSVRQLYIVETGYKGESINKVINHQAEITISPLNMVADNERLEIPINDLTLFMAEQR